MMKMSKTAAHCLSKVRDEQGLPPESTLRITASAPDGELQQLNMGFVDDPPLGDHVGRVGDVAYCMDPDLAQATDSIVLDVDQSSEGPAFFLAEEE